MTDDRPLTQHEIWVWAKQAVLEMTPHERRIVAMALSSLMDDRRAA